ncbi:NAD(P)/FAD-dependent oxidoreductase [Brevundimonas sp. VNH65]|uniref:NAD(P)/FAD-dependent oxidoreductase n=1 Tax=Brevundimonas sp. VNH65 TaxID=3400917 RepID=UPI003BFB9C4E
MTAPPPVRSSDDLAETLVVGAGVLGLCVAAELTRRGWDVQVLDAGGANASAVAAGMIAPALESAVENVSAERAALLRRAADLWPEFAAAVGISLHREGAVWLGEGVEEISDRLDDLGFKAVRRGDRLVVDGESRVEAEPALAALKARLRHPVRIGRVLSIDRADDGWRVAHSDGQVLARRLVLATGAAAAVPGTPEEVARRIAAIQPIGGMTGRIERAFDAGVVRGRGAYAATGPGGTILGATMAFGDRDPVAGGPDGEALVQALRAFSGVQIASDQVDWRAGVRGATADGLPLAGAVETPDLFLALAPRRNGWLLGPLVGRVVADAIEGRAPSLDAAPFDPLRAL